MLKSLLSVVKKFENEMFSDSLSRFEIAEIGEFELFEKDDNNTYGLQFQRDEGTYSIVLEQFNAEDGDWYDSLYLETYLISEYNREFLTSRIVNYIGQTIKTIN